MRARFFHAEDGIRALYVTGVQTCALPISSKRRMPYRSLSYRFDCPGRSIVFSGDTAYSRSEERRVGKECRARMSTNQLKKPGSASTAAAMAPRAAAGELGAFISTESMNAAPMLAALNACSFFSCRRRHTSSLRDWSSDVCSSDLVEAPHALSVAVVPLRLPRPLDRVLG